MFSFLGIGSKPEAGSGFCWGRKDSHETFVEFELGKEMLVKEDLVIFWVWPPHSNSDHQDYYIFNRESL